MAPYLDRAGRERGVGVAAIGVAQEFQKVFAATAGVAHRQRRWYSFTKADRRVTCYYFYIWDADFGPAFIKVCAYFPYPVKVWLNGHEWAKRQATKAGIGFTALSNGFATCDDPAALQAICDRLGPAHHQVFFDRWIARLPPPLTERTGPAATGGSCRCGRSRSPAPWSSTPPGAPAVLRGPRRRQPRHRPARERRNHLPPVTGPAVVDRQVERADLQDQGRHPRHRRGCLASAFVSHLPVLIRPHS